MDAMAPTRPTEPHQRRFRLTREPAAAAEARGQVRAVIRAWKVPVDPDIAVLLTIAADEPAGTTQTGRGLALVAALSTEWGSFRTPAGEVRYFTLAFQPDLHIQQKTPTSEGATW